jgi:SagB-type dehydrogenase family enzyme
MSIGREFMERTKYEYLQESDQDKGIQQPAIERPIDETIALIDLPDFNDVKVNDKSLLNLITSRRSIRKYSRSPLSLAELSFLLWTTIGIKEIRVNEGETGPVTRTLRTVPSAGSRHPFECYILINNVEGLEPGLYRYIATKHKIAMIKPGTDIADDITNACLKQVFVKNGAATFIWVTDIYRTAWRYGDRSYRYVHIDAGHVCQNLYLAAEAIDSSVCAIAAFDDNSLNKVLNLDGESEFVIYLASLGKK